MITDVNLQNIEKVKYDFNRVVMRLSEPRICLEVVAGKGFKDIVNHFSEEQNSEGQRWQPLKKPRKRGGSKLLQDTGRLRASLRFRTLQNEAHVYTQVIYAAAQNFGHEFKAKGKQKKPRVLPAREFMWISEPAQKSILDTFKRFIVNGI